MSEPPSFFFPLGSMPRLVQSGLCLHGARSVESFRQRGLWSLHAYHYKGEFKMEKTMYQFLPGWVSLIPPNFEVEWHFPQHAPHYYAHFRAGVSTKREGISIRILRDLGRKSSYFGTMFEDLFQFTSPNSTKANVRLWDLLFQLTEPTTTINAPLRYHPSLQIALSMIRNTPSDKLLVGEMARQMGVSHNHLTQLFQRHFGCGTREYIWRERIKRACDLLTGSKLQVKSVAIECGFPDLQYFNKVIRRATGYAPTVFRTKMARSGKRMK